MCVCVCLLYHSVAVSWRVCGSQHTTIHVPMEWYVLYIWFKRKPHDTYPFFDVCCYISASRCSLNSLLLVFPFFASYNYNNNSNHSNKEWQRQQQPQQQRWKIFPKTNTISFMFHRPLHFPSSTHFFIFYARIVVYLLNALTIFARYAVPCCAQP